MHLVVTVTNKVLYETKTRSVTWMMMVMMRTIVVVIIGMEIHTMIVMVMIIHYKDYKGSIITKKGSYYYHYIAITIMQEVSLRVASELPSNDSL